MDGFMGALPEPAIRQWLDRTLPTPEAQVSARERAELEALLKAGRLDEARGRIEVLLGACPEDADLRYRMARLLVFEDPARALELVDRQDTPTGVTGEAVEAIRTLARLVRDVEAGRDAGRPDDLEGAVARLRKGDVEGALDALLALLREKGAGSDDRVRRTAVALFHHLGHEHPTTTRYRGEVSRALYV